MDRRVFIRNIGYGTSGLFVLPSMLTSCKSNGNGSEDHSVSIDGMMPIAAISDCSSLLLSAGVLDQTFSNLISADINLRITGNISRLGSSIPFEKWQIADYLEVLKKNWDPEDIKLQQKTSLVLGWVIFHPLCETMSEIYKKLIGQGYHYDTITRYYDTFMMRQVSEVSEFPEASGPQLQNYFEALLPRMITRLHTLKPDYGDGEGWIIRMSDWRVQNKKNTQLYADMLIENDNDKYKQLIKRYNVYDPEDRLIKLVRTKQPDINAEAINKLILADPGTSIYTKSLVQGFKNVIAVSDYFQNRSGIEDIRELL